MSLTKEQKATEISLIAEKLNNNLAVYVTDYMGLNVQAMGALRQGFRKSGVEYRVVKNTLLRCAMQECGGYEELFDFLRGPTAIALSNEPSTAARVIKEFRKSSDSDLPSLKAAYVEGAIFDGDNLDVLVRLKSRDEILGEVIALLLSPASTIASAIQAPGGTLLAILETLQEKGKEEA